MANAKCTHVEPLTEYCLEVVGDDAKQAKAVAKAIKRGIEASADICKMRPSVCVGNLGLARNKMPQVASDLPLPDLLAGDAKDRARARAVMTTGGRSNAATVQAQLLRHLKATGVRITRKRIPVGKLRATQSQIQASKAFGMADAYLKGNFPAIDKMIVVSKDGYILDGHHRWAALLTIDPKRQMSVIEIGLPMDGTGGRSLLKEAAAFPGVYKATFGGQPCHATSQVKYKKESKAALRAATSKKAAKKTKREPANPFTRRPTTRYPRTTTREYGEAMDAIKTGKDKGKKLRLRDVELAAHEVLKTKRYGDQFILVRLEQERRPFKGHGLRFHYWSDALGGSVHFHGDTVTGLMSSHAEYGKKRVDPSIGRFETKAGLLRELKRQLRAGADWLKKQKPQKVVKIYLNPAPDQPGHFQWRYANNKLVDGFAGPRDHMIKNYTFDDGRYILVRSPKKKKRASSTAKKPAKQKYTDAQVRAATAKMIREAG